MTNGRQGGGARRRDMGESRWAENGGQGREGGVSGGKFVMYYELGCVRLSVPWPRTGGQNSNQTEGAAGP